MNECPKLGSAKRPPNVVLWVDVLMGGAGTDWSRQSLLLVGVLRLRGSSSRLQVFSGSSVLQELRGGLASHFAFILLCSLADGVPIARAPTGAFVVAWMANQIAF